MDHRRHQQGLSLLQVILLLALLGLVLTLGLPLLKARYGNPEQAAALAPPVPSALIPAVAPGSGSRHAA